MKVLWLVNNLCEAVEYLTDNTRACGWLYSLCRQLRQQKNIQLHIGFLWGQKIDTFVYHNVVYHPIFRQGMTTRFGRGWTRLQDLFTDRNDMAQLRQCMKIIQEVSPDIIHIHGSEDMFGLITQYENLKCPVVLSIQGLLSSCCLKYYAGLTREMIERNEPLKKRFTMSGFNWLYKNFSRRAEREVVMFKSLRYIIGRTQWDRRCAVSLNPAIRYFTVNEILRPEFLSSTWKKRQSQECFTLATTISSGIFKGLEVIYQAAQLLKNNHFPFVWKIIGLTADDEMVKIVEKTFHLYARDVQLELLGPKKADEVVRELLDSDMYVQVSHIENSPNSVCEAMALGMPIIASFAGGTSSMLRSGTEGVIIQDGNPYELAGAIMEFKQDYNHAIQMGENARIRALKRHNPDNVVRELLDTYDAIINQSK